MKTIEFAGFPHTKTYHGGEIKTAIEAGATVEVSDKEADRLVADFKGLGIGGRDAFRLVEAKPEAKPEAKK